MDTIKADFHTHTKYSKEPKLFGIFEARARHGPEQLIERARSKGLDVVTITDHDTMVGAEIGERYIKKHKISDITMVKGEEVSSKHGHIVGVGLEEPIRPGLSAEETVDRIKSQDGVAIIPHPFTPYGIRNRIFDLKKVDGVEIYNPFACMVAMANRKAREVKRVLNLSSISSTDAHTLSVIGNVFTKIKADPTVESILKGIKKHQTTAESNMNFLKVFGNFVHNWGLCFISWYKKPRAPVV